MGLEEWDDRGIRMLESRGGRRKGGFGEWGMCVVGMS